VQAEDLLAHRLRRGATAIFRDQSRRSSCRGSKSSAAVGHPAAAAAAEGVPALADADDAVRGVHHQLQRVRARALLLRRLQLDVRLRHGHLPVPRRERRRRPAPAGAHDPRAHGGALLRVRPRRARRDACRGVQPE
jgi:hypothetical protein